MKKNKFVGYVMTGALAIGVIGGAGLPAFAATDSTATVEQAVNVKASLDDETKQKLQTIMDELKTQLSDLGVELPTGKKGARVNRFADLDEETKAKAEVILEQEKAGTITKEEARNQLSEIGIEMPAGKKGARVDRFADLDEETKAKAEATLEQEKAGTITKEEARNQLSEIGFEMPTGKMGARGGRFADLDEETKAKAEVILEQEKVGTITKEEAKTQLADLGIELPKKGERQDILADLDEETKEKAQALIDEAKAQFAELGVNHFPLR